MFQILALLFAGHSLIGIVFSSRPQKNEEEIEPQINLLDPEQEMEQNISLKDILKTTEWWVLSFMLLMSVQSGYFVVNEFKNYGDTLNYSDKFLTQIGMIGAIANFLGRFVLSIVQSNIGFKPTFGILALLEFALCGSFVGI